jgi:hypothetical protein
MFCLFSEPTEKPRCCTATEQLSDFIAKLLRQFEDPMPSIPVNDPQMRIWIEAVFNMLRQGEIHGSHIDQLSKLGCPRPTADKLLTFLPLACGRALLADTGVKFSPIYRCMNENGTVGEPSSLSEDSCWVAIDGWLNAYKERQWDSVRIVGTQSAEFDAINKALLNGSKLSDLAGSNPIFSWPNAEPRRRSPWSFWRKRS